MAELGPGEVAHLARIARLALTDDERARLAAEAAGILAHFQAVQGAGAGAEPPVAGSVPARPDEPTEPDPATVAAIVGQFPRRDGALCKVPQGL